ncbi:helix-turn-helix transcriptional regulator [Halocalculus aciditolerans]|uniref:Transcription regulator TrmB N-terminal domain-containing protein n=1 Tax=Halocalculus aciditolerans TaxID=1383812 RepID=A0A830FKB7_9EURY|nr:winged helix-turn-helix domain-containing protein [Halocalculus aciditolerans]GGL55066.1 hypothetical protein GCM10009039_11430 [Halocalculus aciditolerans]
MTPNDERILAVLDDADRALTAAEIAEHTGIPRTSVYKSVRRLRNADEIEARPCLWDARKTVYCLETVATG